MKKKISIVTAAPYVQNYGSICLTYATQEIFKKYGYDAEILNYSRKSFQEANDFKDIIESLHKRDASRKYPFLIRVALAFFLYPSIKKMSNMTSVFFDRYIKVSRRLYTNEEALIKNPPEADIYCTGGDQMWNEQCNFHKTLREFYLSFVPHNKPKISFSTSIGKKAFDEWELPEVLPLLNGYDIISLREKETVGYFNELGVKNVYNLIDPTLLLDREKWDELASHRIIKGSYILMYEIARTGELLSYAKRLAKAKGKRLVRINRFWFHNLKYGDAVYCPSPEQWLSLFKNADCIVTNSFHGVVFSIVFERQFIFVPGANPMRLINMMSSLGIEGRYCGNIDKVCRIYENKIDYSIVQRKLREEREKLDRFFNQIETLS